MFNMRLPYGVKILMLFCLIIGVSIGIYTSRSQLAKNVQDDNNKTADRHVAKNETGSITLLDPIEPRSEPIQQPVSQHGTSCSVPILMYHQIDAPVRGLTVTPDDFRDQMDALLDANYTAISMDLVLKAMTDESVTLPDKPIALTFDDGYDCFYRNAHPILMERDFTSTIFVITSMVGDKGYLSWEQITELADLGYTIGCHTHSHPDLRHASLDSLHNEINTSRKILVEATDQEILSFCYPAGAYNDEVIDAVRTAGFLGAVTTEYGIANIANADINSYTLKRVRIDGHDSLNTFKNKLSIP